MYWKISLHYLYGIKNKKIEEFQASSWIQISLVFFSISKRSYGRLFVMDRIITHKESNNMCVFRFDWVIALNPYTIIDTDVILSFGF